MHAVAVRILDTEIGTTVVAQVVVGTHSALPTRSKVDRCTTSIANGIRTEHDRRHHWRHYRWHRIDDSDIATTVRVHINSSRIVNLGKQVCIAIMSVANVRLSFTVFALKNNNIKRKQNKTTKSRRFFFCCVYNNQTKFQRSLSNEIESPESAFGTNHM